MSMMLAACCCGGGTGACCYRAMVTDPCPSSCCAVDAEDNPVGCEYGLTEEECSALAAEFPELTVTYTAVPVDCGNEPYEVCACATDKTEAECDELDGVLVLADNTCPDGCLGSCCVTNLTDGSKSCLDNKTECECEEETVSGASVGVFRRGVECDGNPCPNTGDVCTLVFLRFIVHGLSTWGGTSCCTHGPETLRDASFISESTTAWRLYTFVAGDPQIEIVTAALVGEATDSFGDENCPGETTVTVTCESTTLGGASCAAVIAAYAGSCYCNTESWSGEGDVYISGSFDHHTSCCKCIETGLVEDTDSGFEDLCDPVDSYVCATPIIGGYSSYAFSSSTCP
ncbi:MAG: hypothetical protein K8R92_00750 [Planctomycetes bacterium]|nr:hypothetical protein [Planctomycetota bacterium]